MWSETILDSEKPVTSPLVILEAVMRLSSKLSVDPKSMEKSVEQFLLQTGLEIIPIDQVDGATAVDAFARYGKGRGHPAQLNIADCLSYACARNRGMKLLFKGNDFSHTDIV